MPSKYVYKNRGKTQNYDRDALSQAVAAVQQGNMSIRKSSELFNVPRSTIGDRISGKHELEVPHGRPPHIPRDIELKIVDSVKMAARRGIGLTRKQLLLRTNVLCNRLKISGGHKTFTAGKDWWQGVKSRHPDLVIKKPERLTSTRARMMNEEVVKRYFKDLGTIMEGLDITDKPRTIWNCDEMSKNFEHDPVRVIAEKGSSCLSRTSSKSTNITIMACVSASGQRMPPMFIVKGKTPRSLYGFNTDSAPENSRWTFQSNGWTDDVIGEQWFNDVFLKFCGPERPQLLILDGHSSHESLGILMKAMDENIHILSLPPHTTHHLQPLDKAVFGPVNKQYNQACSQFLQENPLHQINKWSFPSLFRKAWDNGVSSENIVSGFRACGIYPFNNKVIADSAYGPSLPTNCPLPSSSQSIRTYSTGLPTNGPSSVSNFQSQPPMSPNESPSLQSSYECLPSNGPATPTNCHNIPVNCQISTQKSSASLLSLLYPSPSTSQAGQFHVRTFPVESPSNPSSDPMMSLPPSSPPQPFCTPTLQEVQYSIPSDILDISDPSRLIQLIADGSLLTQALVDDEENEIVLGPLNEIRPFPPMSIDSVIQESFLPATTTTPIIRTKNKRLTSHRLLTSEEIVKVKMNAENIKKEKQQKREMKENKSKSLKKGVKKE